VHGRVGYRETRGTQPGKPLCTTGWHNLWVNTTTTEQLLAPWVEIANTTYPCDRMVAENALTSLYGHASQPPPEVVWAASPGEADEIIRRGHNWKPLESLPLGAAITLELEPFVRSLETQVCATIHLWPQLASELRDQYEPFADRVAQLNTTITAATSEGYPQFGQWNAPQIGLLVAATQAGPVEYHPIDAHQLDLRVDVVRTCNWLYPWMW